MEDYELEAMRHMLVTRLLKLGVKYENISPDMDLDDLMKWEAVISIQDWIRTHRTHSDHDCTRCNIGPIACDRVTCHYDEIWGLTNF